MISVEVRELIRKISRANPRWGSPRIVGELGKLGIKVAKSTVETYRIRPHRSPSPTWRVFLQHHLTECVSMDFFTVPTIHFNVLFVLVVLSHHRRRVIHVNVTEQPTAQWTGQQLIEAFPWASPPTYLLRDRDAIYGAAFRRRVANLGLEQVVSAPRSPWQNPYVERVIGTLRRECFDHVIVLNASHADEFSSATCTITINGGRICRWRWMRRTHDQYSLPNWAPWWNVRRSAAFITIMSGLRHETGEPTVNEPPFRIFGKDKGCRSTTFPPFITASNWDVRISNLISAI